jgi:ankyrin repeat protein
MASELCFAASQGNLAQVQKLLNCMFIHDIDYIFSFFFFFFLSAGRPVDERDGSQQTALHHAARAGHLEIVNGKRNEFGAKIIQFFISNQRTERQRQTTVTSSRRQW